MTLFFRKFYFIWPKNNWARTYNYCTIQRSITSENWHTRRKPHGLL